jgi:hypothetical protein
MKGHLALLANCPRASQLLRSASQCRTQYAWDQLAAYQGKPCEQSLRFAR